MKKSELIAKLAELEGDPEVVYNGDEGWEDIEDVLVDVIVKPYQRCWYSATQSDEGNPTARQVITLL